MKYLLTNQKVLQKVLKMPKTVLDAKLSWILGKVVTILAVTEFGISINEDDNLYEIDLRELL